MTFSEDGAPDWYEGIVCEIEMPPPPAPSLPPSFQTSCVGPVMEVIEVPPTPVT